MFLSVNRRIVALTAAVMCTLPLTACFTEDNSVAGNNIKVSWPFKPVASLSPFSDDALLNTRLGIAETLVTLDSEGKPAPGLAESWEIPDAKTVVFKLREGVKFHDGTELTAKAVANSITKALEAASRPKGLGKANLTVTEKSDLEVEVTSDKDDPILPQRFADSGTVILAETAEERQEAFDALMPLQKSDFIGIFTAMDGLPVTVRLIDPPLHEFLPDFTELSVRLALKAERGEEVTDHERLLLEAVKANHEQNPMLGLRGVRLGLKIKGLFALQIRAIAEAAVECRKRGLDPRPEIMVPLIGSDRELQIVRDEALAIIADVSRESGMELDLPIGNMIELPRAAIRAEQIAEESDFFSFGTNDLTQTTWGFSRDDVEVSFFNEYFTYGIFGISPFETLDIQGVGELVATGVRRGRRGNPNLHCGICGEHGGDPASIHFFDGIGLDYVSCSPFRVPVARLEAGRAAIADRAEATA